VEENAVRVLLVDDQSSVRLLERVMLERDGRAVVVAEAADGQEAVAAATRERPDAIVIDLDMPGVSGLDALPLLLEVCPESVVIVLSSLPESEYGPKVAALGASAFVPKQQLARDERLLLDALPVRGREG
jgi:two-component system nitrate/nitrite response regulator NarL